MGCGLLVLTTTVEDQQPFVLHPLPDVLTCDEAVEGRAWAWLGTVCVRVCLRMVFVGRDVLGWEPSIPNHKMSSSKLCTCLHILPQVRHRRWRQRKSFTASLMPII